MSKKAVNKASRAYKRRRKRRFLFTIELIVLLALVGGLFVYAQIDSKLDKLNTDDLDMNNVQFNDEVIQSEHLQGYMNIALFGVDSREGIEDEATNSDTIIIASINNDTKEVRLVSLYRDTYLKIGDDTYKKANAAYTAGGPEQAISMLNTNLDLDISQYVTVDFNAMITAIDLLGGLEITVTEEEAVHLNNYCIGLEEATGVEFEEIPGEGTYNMTGIQATAYCRIRYTAGNDYKRTERQREVIEKMVEKAKSSNLTTLNKIVDQVFPMVKTNISKNDIISMGTSMLSYSIGDQAGFPFEKTTDMIGKQDCVIPITLESNVIQLHEFLFAGEAYTPSATVVERSDYIINETGYTLEESDDSADEEESSEY